MDKIDVLKSLGEDVTFSDMIRAFEAVEEEINVLKLTLNNIKERLDAIDADLSALENAVYGEIEVECPECHVPFTLSLEEIPEDNTMEVECPNCHSVFTIDLGNWDIDSTDD